MIKINVEKCRDLSCEQFSEKNNGIFGLNRICKISDCPALNGEHCPIPDECPYKAFHITSGVELVVLMRCCDFCGRIYETRN